MKKIAIFLLMVVTINLSTAQEALKKDEQYIQTFAKIAVEEMELYKIPASITLAQGILETGNGQSVLAQVGNNHFGIKCKEEWVGDRMYHDDDARGECFRKYTQAEDSYRDHSLFLAERPYYKKLFLLDIKDYTGWAHGLKKAGYATNPKYAYILINLIKRYQLDQFDAISSTEVYVKLKELYPDSFNQDLVKESSKTYLAGKEGKVEEQPPVLYKENKTEVAVAKKTIKREESNFEFPNTRLKLHPNGYLKYIVIREGDKIEDIAKAYNISVAKLKDYNDLAYQGELKVKQILFLEQKKESGKIKEYTFKEGDNMYDVAQNYGISLIELYRKNSMIPGEEPRIGEKLLLKGQKS